MRVHSYQFGTSQTFGQSAEHFPYNVIGPICTSATPMTPCADPCQVVSLGKGGFITLEFEPPIADGVGVDFIVFENAFRYGSGQVFDEWMIVSASQDGVSWQTFPYDSVSGVGLAGRSPTGCEGCSGPIDWQDPSQAGGDAFDLAVVGIPWAKYIRLTDATHWQSPNRLSADLDGAVAVHQLDLVNLPSVHPDLVFKSQELPIVIAWSLSGQRVEAEVIRLGSNLWTFRTPGPAIVQVWTDAGVYVRKVSSARDDSLR
ncbi:MAG: hypothetical protein NZZ60_00010 [Bacteroidia bacterium]|nr:hypothetical protein [Bacteroidia bacterium]MCX7652314.1 hypothetical protein [Bacteroidia bacterium]MDW8417267.1 hypothetical protein [Bacteroidia bacterium]